MATVGGHRQSPHNRVSFAAPVLEEPWNIIQELLIGGLSLKRKAIAETRR